MITTTTPSIDGKRIVEYKGIVFGEIVSGVDFVISEKSEPVICLLEGVYGL